MLPSIYVDKENWKSLNMSGRRRNFLEKAHPLSCPRLSHSIKWVYKKLIATLSKISLYRLEREPRPPITLQATSLDRLVGGKGPHQAQP